MREKLKTDIPRLVVLLAAAYLLYYLVRSTWVLVGYDWDAAVFPFPLDYGEGPVLDQVVRLAKLTDIYNPVKATGPYTVSNYPPLYHILQVPFVWAFGPAYWYGRAISAIGILAAAVFIDLTLYKLTKDRLASLIGGLMLCASPYIVSWSPLCRVDSLALGLSWAGLYATVRRPGSQRAAVVSAVLLAGAVYTRQSYLLAAPLAAFAWHFGSGRRAQALRLAAWTAGLCIGLFLVITLLTRGGFYFNIVTANINRFDWGMLRSKAFGVFILMPYLVLSSLAFITLGRRSRSEGYWLAAPYLLASAASAATIGKVGSSVNYFFELSAAFSLAAGLIVAASGSRVWLRALLIFLLAGQAALLSNYITEKRPTYQVYRADYTDATARLMPEIKKTGGLVLADEQMGLLPLAGRELYYQPFEFMQLSHAGLWDETPIVEDIRKKRFSLIIVYKHSSAMVNERWTKAQLDAIESSYRPAEKFSETVVYKPL